MTAQPNQPKSGVVHRGASAIYRVRRRIATGLAAVLTVFLGYYVVFGRNGVNSYEQKRTEDKVLHQQIEALQLENSHLKDHVGRLKNDPDAIEFEAREKLHYARPGEVIYTLSSQPTGDKQAAPSVPTGTDSK